MKPFDDQLADNIRKAFDAYEEDVAPGAWEDMQARLDRGGRTRVVPLWPFLAKAAGVALLTGLSIFWYVNFEPRRAPQTFAAQTEETPLPVDEAEAGPETLSASPETHSPSVSTGAPLLAQQSPAAPKPRPKPVGPEETLVSSPEEQADPAVTMIAESVARPSETPAEETIESAEVAEVPTLAMRPQQDPQGRQNGQQTFGTSPERETIPGREKEHRIAWGVTAGSMLAFAEQQVSDGPGFAAGVTAEYNIAPNITLASGGSLTYHQFQLVNFAQEEFAMDYVPHYGSANEVSLSGNNEYEMLALEIPVNAQFSLVETPRRRVYVSTGLSSLVFLQQRFSGTNTAFVEQNFFNDATGQMEVGYTSSTFTVDEKYGPLSRFDFGRLVNLSFGYVMRGENSSVVIEPFVKLPLGRLTSRDISLGMGGVSLKYRFSGD